MKVTEQIDAMRALGTDPLKKLVTPRVIATTFMLFFLTIIADLVGSGGGWLVIALRARPRQQSVLDHRLAILAVRRRFHGPYKPLFFGFIIATVGCYYGLTAKGGTQGVGRATTQAMVSSSVMILMVDFFYTKLLMTLMHVH